MVPRVLVLCFLLVLTSSEEVKRDKRTVDVLLRGVADVFGYDVLRRVTNPRVVQALTNPRPTFFPPPVAPLPSGTYSRIMLALGQQNQQQRQQDEQRAILIPNQGSISANAQALTLPQGAFILPVAGVQPLLASANIQANLGQAAPQQATPQQATPQQGTLQQATPQQNAPQQNAPTPQAPQSTPQTAAQTAPGQAQQAQPAQPAQGFNLPFQILALAPFLGQQAQAQQAPPTTPQPQVAQQQGTPSQETPQGINLVFDSGPTRLNLLAPRPEGVRRTLNFNLNWNREPLTLGAQNQAVQVVAAAPQAVPAAPQVVPATPAPPQSAALILQPFQQLQQPAAPRPTPENFEVLPTQTSQQLNNFFPTRQSKANEQFRQSVKSFWDNSPWNSKNGNLRRADTAENLKRDDNNVQNVQKEEVNNEETPSHYEEYDHAPHTEDYHGEQDDSSEEEKDGNSGESSEETGESQQTPSKRIRYKPGRRVRRMRKVKKSVDNEHLRSHEVVKREEQSYKPSAEEEETEVKDYYKKFVVRKARNAESLYKPIGSYAKDSYSTDFSYTVPETKQDYSALESKIEDVETLFPKNSKVSSTETMNGYTVVNVDDAKKAQYEQAAGHGHASEYKS